MFKWPEGPSPRAQEHEIADFAELTCWQQGSVSATALVQLIGRLAENDYWDGVPEEEDIPYDIENAFREIERREAACNGGYPFTIDDRGTVIYAINNVGNSNHLIYKYMLLATRLNMANNRDHASIDGTELFEHLGAEVARQYLGDRAQSFVFGTAEKDSDFPEKVNHLCTSLGEGGGFKDHSGVSRRKLDDKLDVVAWKPFEDRREGKLIAFGQCKTGTNWTSELSQLWPDHFCSNWFISQPVLTPVRMFFISEALPSLGWRYESMRAGLLFDRCRIIDFCNITDDALLDKLGAWTGAAAEATGLPNPYE